jgi:glycosyltransferase involved in cell wall biosynthesis
MQNEKINIHLYQSSFEHESRILRITKTLSKGNYFDRIFIIATYRKGLKEIEQLDKTRTVFRIKTVISPAASSFLRYLFLVEWWIRIYFKFKKHNVILINPHSVPTLPIAYFLKKKCRAKLLYDTHELETEQYVSTNIKKRFSKYLEKKYIKHVDYLVATSDGYANWYKTNYGLDNISVVKNYSIKRDNPEFNKTTILRDYFGLNQNDVLFIYQGIIAIGRGIEMLLDIFSKIGQNKHIIFMGFGPMEEIVMEYTDKYQNIHFHPAVRPDDVNKYVASCDVGFCIIENIFLSYYYTLPNKMLECLNVGVPVIVSNFPDMKNSIDELDCGWSTEVNYDSIFYVIILQKNRLKKNAKML